MSCTKARDISWLASTCSDRQNPPDAVPWGRFRDTVNVIVDSETALRRGGWQRWGADYDVPDPDLHGYGATTIYSLSQTRGRRVLLAANSSTIRRWVPPGPLESETEGTWLTVGGPPALESGERRSISSVGEICIFAGGIGGATAEAIWVYNTQSGTIAALASETGPTSAQFVIEWRGVMFYLDVVMDSVRVGHRVVWSDFNDPASVDPDIDSIAGFQDLDPGEFILGAAVSGDSLYLFTDRSIWRVVATGDDEVYRFQQTYKSATGHRCLWGPYTLDVLPDGNMIYLGDNGRVYVYSPYQAAPEEPEWTKVGTPDLKRHLTSCRLFVGKVCDNGATLEYLLSYPEAETDTVPTATYAIDFERLCVSRIDHGFLAFHTWYNVSSECPRPTQLILSSAEDDSLKEARFFDVYTRERWDGAEEEWVEDDYDTVYVSGALGFDLPDKNKRMVRMDVLAHTPADQTGGSIQLSVGSSGYPAEPADYFRACPITWFALSAKAVPCATATSVPVPWRFVVENRYLYFRITISGEACALSKIVANIEAV